MLTIQLLGNFRLLDGDEPIKGLRSRKNVALLAYLLLEGDQAHQRSTLAGLLWPESAEKAAALNLRQALYRLKKLFPDALFTITRQTVTCHVSAGVVEVDVVTLIKMINATHAHSHDERHTCAACITKLSQVTDLYRGDFLTGLFLSDNVALEKWILLQREWLQRQVLTALWELTAFYQARGAFESAEKAARQQLTIDPLREVAQRQLMASLAARNDHITAIKEYQQYRGLLQSELEVEPTAETRQLYEQLQHAPPQARRVKLPHKRTAFFGRSAEIDHLSTHLHDPDRRLITLVGMGGIGKTRLAVTVARQLQAAFPDGVWLVPLAPLPTTAHAAMLWSRIATTLDLHLNPTTSHQRQICAYLQQRKALLILDNCEHLLDPVGDVVETLLDGTSQLTLLATSREPLGFYFEVVSTLDGLPFPAATEVVEQPFPAVALFAKRAQLSADWQKNRQTRHAVHKICADVSGHPLAIELVASATRRIPLLDVVTSLQQDSNLLNSDLRGFSERHQSIQLVYEWSWRFLSVSLQAALVQLVVFKGGWTAEAAAHVLGIDAAVLEALHEKSLLRRDETRRYDMHALIERFSAERQPITPTTHDAHARYYLTTLADATQLLRGSTSHEQRQRWNLEIANLERAWEWAIQRNQIDLLTDAAAGLAALMLLRGTYTQAEILFNAALRPLDLPQDTTSLAQLLVAYAPLQSAMGQNDRARSELETVLTALAESDAPQAVEATVSVEVAMLLLFGQIDFRRARELAKRGFSAELPPRTQARAHLCYALSATRLHDYTDNATHFQTALAHFRALDDREGEAITLRSMGFNAYRQSAIEAALTFYAQADEIAMQFDLRTVRAVILAHLSSCYGSLHDFAMERYYLLEGIKLNKQLGRPHDLAILYNNLGINCTEFGEYDTALDHYLLSVEMARELNVNSLAWFLNNLGLLYEHQGDYASSVAACEEARALAAASGSGLARQLAHTRLAQAYTGLGQYALAIDHLEAAVVGWDSAENHHRLIEAHSQRLAIALLQNDHQTIKELIEPVWTYLHTQQGKLLREPLRAYLNCYRALNYLADPRAAPLLAKAHNRLQQQAAKISDPTQRRRYLENVPAHRALMKLPLLFLPIILNLALITTFVTMNALSS